MKIEINITPDDLAKIIVDMKFNRPKCKNVLEQIINNVSTNIDVQFDELNQLQIISEEATKVVLNSGEKKNE